MRKAAPTHARLHTPSRAHALGCARARARARICAAQHAVDVQRASRGVRWLQQGPRSVPSAERLPPPLPGNPSLHALTRCQLSPCVMYLTPLQHELRKVSAPLQRRCSHGASASDDSPRPATHRLRAAVLSATSAQLHAPPEHTAVGPIPVQMWQEQIQSRRRRVGGERGTGEDVAGVSPVPALIR